MHRYCATTTVAVGNRSEITLFFLITFIGASVVIPHVDAVPHVAGPLGYLFFWSAVGV